LTLDRTVGKSGSHLENQHNAQVDDPEVDLPDTAELNSDHENAAPEEPNEISDNDRARASLDGIPAYVVTPFGKILRFTPYPRSWEGHESQVGTCGCKLAKPNQPELW
jgi:hypothetical protein